MYTSWALLCPATAPLPEGSELRLFSFIVFFSICFLFAGFKYYNPSGKKKWQNPHFRAPLKGSKDALRSGRRFFIFFFNHPRVEMQIFPRAVASLSLFKTTIWERFLPEAAPGAPQRVPVPPKHRPGEGEHTGMGSGCAAALRLFKYQGETASSWQRGEQGKADLG